MKVATKASVQLNRELAIDQKFIRFENVNRYLDLVSAFEDFVENHIQSGPGTEPDKFGIGLDIVTECTWMKSINQVAGGDALIDDFCAKLRTVLSWDGRMDSDFSRHPDWETHIISIRHKLLQIGRVLFN